MTTLNRMNTPPVGNSREMRAYMAAILEVTGMMAGQGFPLDMFLANYATHLSPQTSFAHATIRKAEDGLYHLTPEGTRFFSSRLTATPVIAGQHVGRVEVIEMIRKIVAQPPEEGWSAFEVELKED